MNCLKTLHCIFSLHFYTGMIQLQLFSPSLIEVKTICFESYLSREIIKKSFLEKYNGILLGFGIVFV